MMTWLPTTTLSVVVIPFHQVILNNTAGILMLLLLQQQCNSNVTVNVTVNIPILCAAYVYLFIVILLLCASQVVLSSSATSLAVH